jgi:hypothetical protein
MFKTNEALNTHGTFTATSKLTKRRLARFHNKVVTMSEAGVTTMLWKDSSLHCAATYESLWLDVSKGY